MHQRCVAALEEAALKLGRKMTRSEIAKFSSGVEKGVTDMYRALAKDNPAQWRTMSKEERAAAVGEKLTTHLKAEAAKQAQRERKNLVSVAKGYSMLNEAKADGRGGIQHLKHRLAFIADGKGNVVDAEYRARAVEAEYMEMLRPLLDLEKQGSVLGLFYNKEGTNQVVMELKGKSTGNPDAKIAAQHVREFLTSIAKDFNDKGGNIAIIDDYIMQKQAPHRVFKATQKTWVDDALRNVNREKLVDLNGNQLDDAKARQFLEESWYNLAYDGEFRKSGEGVASIANRHKAHRQLEWKSPEAWIEMNDKYGAAPLMDQLQAYAQTMSREIVLMEQFGPSALHNIETLTDYAKSLDRTADQKAGKQLVKDITDLEGMVSHFSGLDQGIKSHFWHKFFKTVKDINVANKLGSVITSQLADNGTAISTVRALNMNLGDWLTHKAKNYTNEQLKSFSRSNGLAFDMIVNDLVRFSDGANPYDITGKLAQTTMKISGASMMTEIHRRSVATFILDQLGQLSRKHDWDTLDVDSKNILVGKGWTKLDWDIVRAAEADTSYGGQGVGMDQIKSIDPEKIRALMPNEMKAIEQGAADIQAMMGAQNQKDSGWLQNRQTKFAEYKDKIQKMIDDYVSTREKRVEDYSSTNMKRGGEMMARLEQAEVELELTKASIDATNEKRADKFAEEVKRGMETYGRRRSEIGETLGAKRHSAKLQAAGADRAYTKLSEQLIAKKNELFGHERVEDGLVVIGELNKAVKELDAYTAKLEKRIENSYKKDGGVKKGKEGTIERAEKLKDDAKIEYEAIKQSVEGRMSALKEKVTGSQMEIRGIIDSIEAKKTRAEAEADIASYLATEKNADKVQGLLDTLEFRRDQTADRMMSEGERIGYKKAMAEAKVKAMAKREEAYAKTANKEVFAKATELEKRIDKRMAELEEFTSRLDERIEKRNEISKAHHEAIGKLQQEAIENARKDAYLKITAYALQEAEMAVLQPSLSTHVGPLQLNKGGFLSELGGAILQFKTFPMAMWMKHIQQRANMTPNPMAYRASLLASTAFFGGIGLIMGDLATGKDPREIYSEKDGINLRFGLDAILKGGGLGFFGDMLQAFSDENSRGVEKISGPFLGQVSRTLALGKELLKEAQGKDGNVAKALINLGRELLPFNNLIWTRAVWNNVIASEMNEWASPGYMARARELAHKNYDSSYWIGMNQETRSPNFGNIVGQ